MSLLEKALQSTEGVTAQLLCSSPGKFQDVAIPFLYLEVQDTGQRKLHQACGDDVGLYLTIATITVRLPRKDNNIFKLTYGRTAVLQLNSNKRGVMLTSKGKYCQQLVLIVRFPVPEDAH